MTNERQIMIFPILPDKNIPYKNSEEKEKIPSLRGYLSRRNTISRAVPILTLKSVFRQISRLSPEDLGTHSGITGEIARELLNQGEWTWQLPELIKDISSYMQQFSKDRIELDEVRKEMTKRLSPIFIGAKIEDKIIISTLINQIITVFSSCHNRTSLQEISDRLQKTPSFKQLPEEVVDSCVDEFFDILFSRGYISFLDD